MLVHLNVVRIAELVSVCVKDPHIFIRISVELFADLRQVITGLDCVALTAFSLTTTGGRAHRAPFIDTNVGSNVIRIRTEKFDLVPELVVSII